MTAPDCPLIEFGDLAVDHDRVVRVRGDVEGYLTRSEATIMTALVAARGRCVSKTKVFEALYGDDIDGGPLVGEKIIDVFLCKLRRRLAACRSDVVIATVRGVGWRVTLGENIGPVTCGRVRMRFITHAEVARAGITG